MLHPTHRAAMERKTVTDLAPLRKILVARAAMRESHHEAKALGFTLSWWRRTLDFAVATNKTMLHDCNVILVRPLR